MTDQRTIVVGIDASPGSEVAQRWAVEEARARKQPLRLVCAFTWNINTESVAVFAHHAGLGIEELKRFADHTVQAALDTVDGGGLDIAGAAVEGSAVDVLLNEAEPPRSWCWARGSCTPPVRSCSARWGRRSLRERAAR